MAEMEVLNRPAQTEIVVIPIIDVSGSMYGERIGSVNDAMREVPEQLKDINDDVIDSKLLIAPMQFSTNAEWFSLQNGKPAEVDTFRWIDRNASGLTDLGAACKLLAQKLTVEEKGGWMKGRGGAAPVIILISDGAPTDEYKPPLAELKKRGWFRAALKFAVAVEGADKDVLAEFTGNPEAVIDTTVIRNSLSSVIKLVIRSASQTASQTASMGAGGNLSSNQVSANGPDADAQAQQEAIDAVQNELKLDAVSTDPSDF